MQTIKIPAALPALIESMGVDPVKLWRRGGLPVAALGAGGDLAVTTRQMFRLWRTLGELTPDPAIGLKIVARIPADQQHPAGIVAQHSRNLREGIRRFARYKLLCCGEEVDVAETAAECRVTFEWLHADEAPPPLLLDGAFASLLELARRGTGRSVHPLRVEYRHAGRRDAHEAYFGCPVKFRARRNAVVFRTCDLDLPFAAYNAELIALLAPELDREVGRRRSLHTVSDRTKWVVKRMLSGGRPGIAQVARELGLGARTLQRRIMAEGASFRCLVGDARHELARHYLRQPSLEFAETACLLGYEDPNSFFRAFRTREGATPGEWRAAQRSP